MSVGQFTSGFVLDFLSVDADFSLVLLNLGLLKGANVVFLGLVLAANVRSVARGKV